ncbi:MAG: SPASM domain-containing protein, partial [Candidatus Rokubacteria bacterium]|nr:SPASM domain-containing protein [Candidatus Rokubacteria bacterium]
ERGVIILVKSPLMNLNSGEYHGIVALAEELGAGYGFDPLLVPMRDGDQTPVGLSLDREQMRAFFSDPVLAREMSQPVKCLPQPGEEICGTGRRTCLISPYGDLFPCGVHPIPAGNLREKSFHQIWTGSPLLRDLRTKTVDDLRGGAKEIGGFRCSALALIEDGDFLGPFHRGEEMAEIQAEVQGGRGSGPA